MGHSLLFCHEFSHDDEGVAGELAFAIESWQFHHEFSRDGVVVTIELVLVVLTAIIMK